VNSRDGQSIKTSDRGNKVSSRPALSIIRIMFFKARKRDFIIIMVRNKKVCESFQTQTQYLNVYPYLYDQTKPTIP